jgi:hypothetical protein
MIDLKTFVCIILYTRYILNAVIFSIRLYRFSIIHDDVDYVTSRFLVLFVAGLRVYLPQLMVMNVGSNDDAYGSDGTSYKARLRI